MRHVYTIALLAVLFLLPLLSGCIPAAVMAKHAVEERSEDSRLYAASVERVWPATLAALYQLRVQVTKTVKDSLGGDIDGVWFDGNDVVVRVDYANEGQTRVRVRVGGMRNREATERIFSSINNNL